MAENSEIKTINIALQGGGAHGAFSWGVLDRLLEDERIEIEGICSASAGTMNACALAYGLHLGEADGGGRERARETLARFWRTVHEVGETYSQSGRCRGRRFWGASRIPRHGCGSTR